MKILYIHQYFKTPNESGGNRSYWFAKELVKNNHQVTLISSRFNQDKKFTKETIDNIDIIYIKVNYSNNMNIFKRMVSFVKFTVYATYISLKQKNINLVFATSTPLTIGIPALILNIFKKTPFIFEVRDLWPEVPIQMGGLKNKLFIFLAKKLELSIYKRALHIIALSPGMKEGILTLGIPTQKISMIPNMSKIDIFYPRPKDQNLVKKYNFSENNLYIIHFGTIGIANGLDYILDTAKIIQNNNIPSIKFLFAGNGGQENHLKNRCQKETIYNVEFLGDFNMINISEIVNIADCSIVCFKNIPILKTNSPNKFFDSLSANKPIIVNSSGWTKEIVEKYNCGAYVDPENPNSLAQLLIHWNENKKLLSLMGDNGRKLALNKFDKSILTAEFIKLINSLNL